MVSTIFSTENLDDIDKGISDQNEKFYKNWFSGNGIGESSNIQKNATLAYNLDLLLLDSSALSFFIQFLESCDKLNLIKFWMHVEGFKASVNNCQVENSEVAVQSLSLLDARNIFEKYIDDDSSSTISLPRKIKHRIDENLTKQPLKVDCFDDAQHFVRQLFELRYFPEFQVSIYYKKHELFVLSRGCSLFDIIHVQFLLLSFLEYIDLRTDHDRLQFLIACESFENNLESLSDEDALNDAMSIYDKYFSMQAPNPINLGCAERTEMESLICTVAGRPSPASFRTAKQLCANILHDKYLHRFIHSSAYHSYLVDLSAQIQNTVELPRPSCTRQCTNSSSDGFSSNDSLPLVFRRHFENLERVASVRTPTQSPKTIKNKNVNLAEIDSLGRYRTLYDDSLSLQEGNASSKFRQRLRKYLDKETLREEEIAEEVARTIIDDVHKMVEAGKRG